MNARIWEVEGKPEAYRSGPNIMGEKFAYFDRRIIYLLVAAAVVVPFVTGWTLPRGEITPSTQNLYDAIESLPPRTPVMVVFDYGPSGMPELDPMALALTRHILSRDLRLLGATLVVTGTQMCQNVISVVAEELHKQEGIDWVNLGYKPGGGVLITQMGEDIKRAYPTDAQGHSTHQLEIMQGIHNYDDIALVIDLASGNSPGAWIIYAYQPYKVKVAAGITAVMATDYYPFLQTGQLIGLLNGLKGAAEYEDLIDHHGLGILGMFSQSVAHLLIILFVILGNISYFAFTRRR